MLDRAVKASISIHPNSKVYGANMGLTWGRQDPDGTHVGLTNFAIWGYKNGDSS